MVMPIDFQELKKKHRTIPKTKPPTEKKPPLVQTEPQAESEVDSDGKNLFQKKLLIKQLFDENQDLPLEDFLVDYINKGDGKKMGKTISPLKGIREGLEDMLNIQQLKDLLGGFRNMRNNNNNKKEEEEDNSNNNMMAMLPLLQQIQNKGNNGGNKDGMFGGIDPSIMMMLMNSGKKGGSNDLGQLFFMMSMAKLLNPQQQNTNTGNTNSNQQQGNMNADVISSLYKELQNVMGQQQQQKPAIDPMTMLMINSINKSNQVPPPTNQNFEVILDKFNTMMSNNQAQQFSMALQQSNDRFERGMEMVAGALNREKPEERIRSSLSLFREITGDKREKGEKELEFDLKRQELKMREEGRIDMLDREERAVERENAKSERLTGIATTVLDKVIGSSVGNLVQDVMSAKSESGSRRGRKGGKQIPQSDFDPSYLDEL